MAEITPATRDGQAQQERSRWLQRAEQGDPVAQYNLGMSFLGAQAGQTEPGQANYWFKKAAEQGLVQAYNKIQTAAIKPSAGQRIVIIQNPQEWIKAQNPKYYTLQLASSTNQKLIQKYFDENQLQGRGGYYRNRRQGEDWYALVYGAYPTVGDANAAIDTLPQDLRKWSPWVRSLKDIQRIMN